jgi:hypothetical protein
MTVGVEARLERVLGPARARQVREIATALEDADGNVIEAFGQLPPVRPATPQYPVTIPVLASDAASAGGADLIRRTVSAAARHDSPDVQDKAKAVIAALRDIAPKTAIEGGLAGLFVAMERAAMDCLRLARLAGFDSPMGAVMLSRAEKLACRATEVADGISRQRYRGQQTVRVEHVHIHGGQAVVGSLVNAKGSRDR